MREIPIHIIAAIITIVAVACLIAAIICPLLYANNLYERSQCNRKALVSGYETKYDWRNAFDGVCYAKTENGKFVPFSQLREIN